jgi:hypothetical protein
MNAKYIFYQTLVISIIVQVITGIIEVASVFVKVPSEYLLIKQLIIMELIVQVVESIFYVWLAFNFKKVVNVTPKRYVDWAITTPTMLITLMSYLIFINKKSENKTHELDFFKLLKENASTFITVLSLNWLMLLFGYLSEIKKIPFILGVILGFIPFIVYYYIIYNNFVNEDTNSYLFWYFFFFWSLYGIVSILPYYTKNAWYNILDLFAKNFFGLLLSYIVFFDKY